uniref:Uncharacterized protein n=1 Tax=Amphimedon queenslandica TaxID=400682 RepID=A0A1X7UCM9_AMPQE
MRFNGNIHNPCSVTQKLGQSPCGCFSPLVFSTSGGFGPVLALFIKRLATLHSEKFQRSYSVTINLIHCRYSFAILKAAIRCLRGSRSRVRSFDSNDFCKAISEAPGVLHQYPSNLL